jgi:hypothetical protein
MLLKTKDRAFGGSWKATMLLIKKGLSGISHDVIEK